MFYGFMKYPARVPFPYLEITTLPSQISLSVFSVARTTKKPVVLLYHFHEVVP